MPKKILLFNLSFVQTKPWAKYHGGAENDYSVLMALLEDIGNQPGWEIYGYYEPGYDFVRDITVLLQQYKNFSLITDKELLTSSFIFHSIYTSDIKGLNWLRKLKLQSKMSLVVIHGIRRYELPVKLFDLFLPNRLRDKVFVLKSFLLRRWMNRNIIKQHQSSLDGLPSSVKIIATSQDTRHKLLAMCPNLAPQQIRTLYTSPKISYIKGSNELDILQKYGVKSKKFFLLISLSRIEKNVYFALKHLHALCNTHDLPFKILACGESKKNRVIDSYKQYDNVMITGYIPTADLAILYKHAFLFIYPTRSEGFGMPILEAMEHGTPVCCSALSPLIEVGGDAPEYFSLDNEIEFKSKVLRLYLEPNHYERKCEMARERFTQMTELQRRDLIIKKELLL